MLLHGFPTSSYMFRHLLPALADRYHVIAPDHLGFGLSDAPSVQQFDYTFDALTDLTAGLVRECRQQMPEHVGAGRKAVQQHERGFVRVARLAEEKPVTVDGGVSMMDSRHDFPPRLSS
ncbi:hypothetical protein A5713_09230 [Mycobacterium sp. E2497]|nr:hypothetical protein A5713_09230 [Mycobacterium sp. E2497]